MTTFSGKWELFDRGCRIIRGVEFLELHGIPVLKVQVQKATILHTKHKLSKKNTGTAIWMTLSWPRPTSVFQS